MGISRIEYVFEDNGYSIFFRYDHMYYGFYNSRYKQISIRGIVFKNKSSEYQQTATKEIKKWLNERGLEC